VREDLEPRRQAVIEAVPPRPVLQPRILTPVAAAETRTHVGEQSGNASNGSKRSGGHGSVHSASGGHHDDEPCPRDAAEPPEAGQ